MMFHGFLTAFKTTYTTTEYTEPTKERNLSYHLSGSIILSLVVFSQHLEMLTAVNGNLSAI